MQTAGVESWRWEWCGSEDGEMIRWRKVNHIQRSKESLRRGYKQIKNVIFVVNRETNMLCEVKQV